MAKLKKSTLTVAAMMGVTVIAKVLGMLRSVVMASHYGTSEQAVAFSSAQHIPLNLFDIAFGAAILGCFIPLYNQFGDERKREREEFACGFLTLVLCATGIIALCGILFADVIINIMTPGIAPEIKTLAAMLLRIMFPMIIFTGSTYTLVGVMQSKGRYFLPAAVSAISNGIVVLYLLFIDGALGESGIYGLALAYLAAWLVQLLTLAIPLWKSGSRFRFRLDLKNAALRAALKMSLPIMFGSWLTPFSVQIGLFFASFVSFEGAVTVFDYSYTTFAMIAGILTYSICNYAFPLLSKAEGEEWNGLVRDGLKSALRLIIPFTGAGVIFSREIISVLYLRDSFTVGDARESALVLSVMACALPAFSVIEICNRVFYSQKLVKIPMYASVFGIIANVIFSAVAVKLEIMSTAACAIGYCAGLFCAAAILILSLVTRKKGLFDRRYLISVLGDILFGVGAIAIMAAIYGLLKTSPFESGMIGNILNCVIAFAPSVMIYLGAVLIKDASARKNKN